MVPIILILVFLQFNVSNSRFLDYSEFNCSHDSSRSYLLQGLFDTNRNQLLSNLASEISTVNDDFVTIKQGLENEEPAYGLALCRGDLDRDDCKECVNKAGEVLKRVCQTWEGIIWMENCTLRFSNYSFFSLLQLQPNSRLENTHFITNHVEDWTKLLNDSLRNVTSKAASFKSGNKFATTKACFSPLKQNLYALAQCTPNLTREDCTKCFGVAKTLFYSLLRRGGIVLMPSCNLRYELYEFFNLTKLKPSSSSPISSIAPSTTDIARIIPDDLFSELKVLQMTLPNNLMSASEILEFVKAADCYPNVSIAYRILLTMPVTVASAERSFSKLKLLKTYLRSSMSQERLNGLATLCIEKNMLEHINVETIISDFASRKARRNIFI